MSDYVNGFHVVLILPRIAGGKACWAVLGSGRIKVGEYSTHQDAVDAAYAFETSDRPISSG